MPAARKREAMIAHSRSWLRCFPVALLVGAITAPAASAAWLGFRNDLGHAVVIRTSSEIKGAVRSGIPHRLHPGEVAWDWIGENTAKKVTIHDARSPRTVLHRFQATTTGQQDLFYIIEPSGDSPPGQKTVHVVKTSGSKANSKARPIAKQGP